MDRQDEEEERASQTLASREGLYRELEKVVEDPTARDQDKIRAVTAMADMIGVRNPGAISDLKRLSYPELLEHAKKVIRVYLEMRGHLVVEKNGATS